MNFRLTPPYYKGLLFLLGFFAISFLFCREGKQAFSLSVFAQTHHYQEKYLKNYKRVDKWQKKEKTFSQQEKEEIKKKFKIDIPDKFIYYEGKKNKNIFYAIISKAQGKLRDFLFLVVFNKNIEIEDLKILEYREVEGRAIKQKNFLKQFKGKKFSSLKKDNISAISGATISSAALLEKVKEITLLLEYVISP